MTKRSRTFLSCLIPRNESAFLASFRPAASKRCKSLKKVTLIDRRESGGERRWRPTITLIRSYAGKRLQEMIGGFADQYISMAAERNECVTGRNKCVRGKRSSEMEGVAGGWTFLRFAWACCTTLARHSLLVMCNHTVAGSAAHTHIYVERKTGKGCI
jgi:hypothetical protein